MTDQRDETKLDSPDTVVRERVIGVPPTISRRAMLRGATATVPTILTLTSGAALARSSNMIKVVDTATGDVSCLNTTETEGVVTEGLNVYYDLGPKGYAEVTEIPSTYSYMHEDLTNVDPVTGAVIPTPLSPDQVCAFNGTVHIDPAGGGSYTVQKPITPGVMVSSSAVTSFGIVKTNILDL